MNTVFDRRADAARRWASERLGFVVSDFQPASADASFRRYFRVRDGARSWIVMDAPPEQEDCAPFVAVASLMAAAGLHVPKILFEDLAQGFLLLSDLGARTYLEVLDAGNADELFGAALDALAAWQRASKPGVLPAYDSALLHRELALFPDWFLARHLGVTLAGPRLAAWSEVAERLVTSALAQPRVYVHRDFMPRNLMRSTPSPGVLDFQDAVYGPISYDVVCLFKDAFVSWPAERVDGWIAAYRSRALAAGLPVGDTAEFRRALDWMGVQRHLKVLGIFARIRYRDGKPKYLEDAPRFMGYIREVAEREPSLAVLAKLLDDLGLES